MKEFEFTRYVVPLRDRMFRYAQSLLLCADEAEDVTHDLLERLWTERGRLDGCRDIASFVMAAVRNRCYDCLRTGMLGCRAVYGIQVYLADGFYTDHHIGLSFYHLRFRLFREIFRCSCFCGSLSCGFFLLGFLRFRLLLFLGYPLFLLFLALCLINLLYQLFFALVLLESLFKDLINVSLYLRVRVGFYLYAFFGQILHCPIHRDVEFG